MTENNSQIGIRALEPTMENDNGESNIDQLLQIETVTTNQSLMQFNSANMLPSQTSTIANIDIPDHVTRRQQAQQRQRQRGNQQRREQQEQLQRQREAQRRQQQEQRRQEQEQQLRRREKNRRRYERWQERQKQRQQEREQQ